MALGLSTTCAGPSGKVASMRGRAITSSPSDVCGRLSDAVDDTVGGSGPAAGVMGFGTEALPVWTPLSIAVVGSSEALVDSRRDGDRSIVGITIAWKAVISCDISSSCKNRL